MRNTDGDADALIRMLYGIAEDAEAPASSRLSAIKEILDRTVGKGPLPTDDADGTGGEIVFRMEGPPDTT